MDRWRWVLRAAVAALLSIILGGCAPAEAGTEPMATPDIALLETRTEMQLAARLTAIAPAPTPSPVPTHTSAAPQAERQATNTPTPPPVAFVPPLVIVSRSTNDAGNVVVPAWAGEEAVLTHFADPMSIYALRWTNAGDRLALVSSHDFAYSRDNERNLFLMRADGAELEMITGDYVAPEDAPGPFLTLQGRVEGSAGPCRVTAQGMGSLVDVDAAGAFTLEGVPESAAWVRAVCQGDSVTYQGTTDLNLAEQAGPVVITVQPAGQGWRDVSFSPDDARLVGTRYQWSLDEQGEVIYELQGVLYDLESGQYGTLEIPEGMSYHGGAWSPDGSRIVGGLSDEEAAYLWQWDPQGVSLGELYRIDNPEDQMLSIVRPVWSPGGTWLAFELHRWYWWSGEKFRSDLWRIGPDGQNAAPVLEVEWGWHATHASWNAAEDTLFYQLYTSERDLGGLMPAEANIWSVSLETQAAVQLTEDGASYLPAVRPVRSAP